MQNLITSLKREYFPIGLIVILALSRLIPHPDNFTPIIAIAIMGSYFFNNINLSYLVVLFSMLIADFFIGFYGHMIFVYMSLLLITFVFFKTNWKINFKNLFIFGFIGSVIFFIISNFGVWAISSMYEKSFDGLVHCYFLAIPFFKNTFLSTLVFSYTAFLAHKYIKKYQV